MCFRGRINGGGSDRLRSRLVGGGHNASHFKEIGAILLSGQVNTNFTEITL